MSSINQIHANRYSAAQLKAVYQDTLKTAPDYDEKSEYICYNDLPEVNTLSTEDAKILISNTDTLVLAEAVVNMKLKPLVLNLASETKPGGGVINGKSAQEEEIFRRMNYFRAMDSEKYPLNWSTVIISPNITCYKTITYSPIKEPFKVDMIAAAALKYPLLVDNTYQPSDALKMFQKIDAIFKLAYMNKNDALVLGALGCGIYKNNPVDVANIFKVCIDKYRKHFKLISFGILGKNYTIFNKILKE